MADVLMERGVGAFWAQGELSAIEQACLFSYAAHGYDLVLFSYETIPNVPPGIKTADATEVIDRKMTERVLHDGKPDLAHFSDLFRYEMVKACGRVWVDSDLLMLRSAADSDWPDILAQEDDGGVNGAIFYIADHRNLDVILAQMRSKLDTNLRWGDTGPRMISAFARSQPHIKLYDHSHFYPIGHHEIWKVFLPSHCEECRVKCQHASTIHLFNNILTRMGLWKDIAPPVGSYLHTVFDEIDALRFFKDVYPARVLEACIENFRFRQNGKALGVKSVLREFLPSIGRTYRHYHAG